MKSKYFIMQILFSIIVFTLDVEAKEYNISKQGKVSATISDKSVTRIEVENDRISQVIGNEEEYIIDSDADLGQIFITPILKAGKEINLNIITEQGRVIDAKFSINSTEAEAILLKYENSNDKKQVDSKNTNNLPQISTNDYRLEDNNDHKQNIIEALKQVRNLGQKRDKVSSLNCIKHYTNISYLDAYCYKISPYNIFEIHVVNKTDDKANLKEEDFSNCLLGTKAIAIENHILLKDQTTKIYLVNDHE